MKEKKVAPGMTGNDLRRDIKGEEENVSVGRVCLPEVYAEADRYD